jgi:hypothetical protein
MKRFSLFLFLIFITQIVCEGQDKKNVIKVNPINLFASAFTVCYERILTPERSLQVQFDYLPKKNFVFDSSYGFRLTAEYRFYVTTRAYDIPNGVYLAPFLSYGCTRNPYHHNESMPLILGFGGIMGYQRLIQNNLSIDLFFGPAAMIGPQSVSAVYPRAGITIGIPF